jgi:hypothetical protein
MLPYASQLFCKYLISYSSCRSEIINYLVTMVSSWPDFAIDTAAKRQKVDIIEQCLLHGARPQTTGEELAAAVSSDENLKDGIISAWTIITSAVNVFSSNDDIAKIVQILIAFAALASTAEEAGIKDNFWATRSWMTLGRTLNEDDWNGESRPL